MADIEHRYLGKHWRADRERSASCFPRCSCGWVGSSVSALLERREAADVEFDRHVRG